MTIKLSETKVDHALAKLSWEQLSAHLSETAVIHDEVEKLIGLVKRSESLVLKRKNPSQERKREQLLCNLANFLDTKHYQDQAELVRNLSAKLKEIDGVYQEILNLLTKTKAAALSPELRVSALLGRANREYMDLQTRMSQSMNVEGFLDLGKATLKDDNGNEFSPDAIHEALLSTFASTLGMEAHIHGWYDASGVLTLPALPPSNEEDQFAVGSIQYLAAAWQKWQFAERRHRYLNGSLTKDSSLSKDWLERGFSCLWQSFPADDDRELNNYLAMNRLVERLRQHWALVLSNPTYRRAVSGIDGVVELLPKGTISLNELHSATTLSQLLSGEITNDHAQYAGLTLAEWVRGYSALQCICEAALDTGEPDRLTIKFSRSDLESLLEQLGLSNGTAKAFIEHATFRKASRDLFDQPLIKMQDGSLILLALAGASSSIPNIILSTLGMLEVNLDSRGKRFERRIIEFLEKQGIEAKNIMCNRDGETYDYDVAFVWGDYFFLLECKSRSLSTTDPIRGYYFSLGIRNVIKQVKRLANGLQRYPDILSTHFPEAIGKQVVHCVINSLPYAMFGEVDGIYFTDEGGLTRFFQQSEIGPRSIKPYKGLGSIDPATAVAFLWDGARPTPEDFLRQLKTPIQLVIARSHIKQSQLGIRVGEQTALGLFEYGRADPTPTSIRHAAREAGYRTGVDQ